MKKPFLRESFNQSDPQEIANILDAKAIDWFLKNRYTPIALACIYLSFAAFLTLLILATGEFYNIPVAKTIFKYLFDSSYNYYSIPTPIAVILILFCPILLLCAFAITNVFSFAYSSYRQKRVYQILRRHKSECESKYTP